MVRFAILSHSGSVLQVVGADRTNSAPDFDGYRYEPAKNGRGVSSPFDFRNGWAHPGPVLQVLGADRTHSAPDFDRFG